MNSVVTRTGRGACIGAVGILLLLSTHAFGHPAPSALAAATIDKLHTQLEESRPADTEVLTVSPTEVWLRFSTEVQRALSTIQITRADGSTVPMGRVLTVEGSGNTELSAAVPGGLEPGTYTVAWTTAGPDSHIIEGTFRFAVAGSEQEEPAGDSIGDSTSSTADSTSSAADSGVAAAAPVEPALEPTPVSSEFADATAPVGLAARWFSFLGSILLIGLATFYFGVVGGAKRRGEAEAVAAFLPKLRGFGYIVATLALVASVLRLMDGVVSFGAGRMGALMFGSPWGLSWWLFALGAIAAFAGVRMTGRAGTQGGGWRLVAVGGLLTAVSMPFAGHGWSAPSRLIAAPAHVLHTLGAGIWMGSLAVLVLVALPFLSSRRDAEGRSPEASAWVASFSTVATIGVVTVIVTGGVNAWQHIGSFSGLFGTAYGRTLLVKLGVLGGALLLGLYNLKQARPALDETGRPGLIRLPATVELILGFGVLLVTAVLVAMHLP